MNRSIIKVLLLCSLLVVGIVSAAVEITGFSPSYACPGTPVTVTGSGFGAVQGASTITFNNVPATSVTSWTDTQIVAVMPAGGGGQINIILINQQHAVSGSGASSGNNVDAFDSNLGTRWESAFSDPQWIYADLGGLQTVNRVLIDWEGACSSHWEIQIQTNAVVDTNFFAWTVVGMFSNFISANHKITTNSFPDVQARYVRMYGYTRNLNYGHSIYEMKIFNYDGDMTSSNVVSPVTKLFDFNPKTDYAGNSVTIRGSGFGPSQGSGSVDLGGKIPVITSWNDTNIIVTVPTAANGPVVVVNDCGYSASSGVGFVNTNYKVVASAASTGDGAGAFDADLGSTWQSGTTDPEWLMADFGSQLLLNRLVFDWENASAGKYSILVTTNKSDTNNAVWTPVLTYSNDFSFLNHKKVTNIFSMQYTRYVKVSFSNRNTPWGSAIFNLDIGKYWGTNFVTKASAAPDGALSVHLISPLSNSLTLVSDNSFTWHPTTAPGTLKDYVFEIATNPSFTTSSILYVTGTNTNISLLDDVHYWRVRGRDLALAEGTNSSTWSLQVDANAPIISARSPTNGATSKKLSTKFSFNVTDGMSGVQSNWISIDTNNDLVMDVILPTVNLSTVTQTFLFSRLGTNNWLAKSKDNLGNLRISPAFMLVVNTNKIDTTAKIYSFGPRIAMPGDTITINGKNFGALQGTATLTFNGIPATSVLSWNDTQIQAVYPAGGNGPIVITKESNRQIPVVASTASSGGNGAAAFDNNDASRWESLVADPQWITADFGKNTNFNHITILWEPAYSLNMEIRAGNDTNNLETVYMAENPTGIVVNWTQSIDFPVVNARYVQMYGIDRATGYGHSIWEMRTFTGDQVTSASNMEVFTPVISDFNPKEAFSGTLLTITGSGFGNIQGTGSVIIAGVPAVVDTWGNTEIKVVIPPKIKGNIVVVNGAGLTNDTSSFISVSNSYPAVASAGSPDFVAAPALAFDNNIGTRWESIAAVDPQWVSMDLGSVVKVNQVLISWEGASAATWQIQYQTNAIIDTNLAAWSVAGSGNDTQAGTKWTTNTFTPVMARHVRMYGQTRNTVYGYSIWEMNARYITPVIFTALLPPPTAPTNLVPVNNFQTTNQDVSFSWHPTLASGGTNLDYFIFQYSTDSGMAGATSISMIGTNTNLLLTEGSWYWRVKAIDVLGNVGSNSPINSFIIDMTAPVVTVVSPSSNIINYSMTAPLDWTVSDAGVGVMSNWLSIDTNNDMTADIVQGFVGTNSSLITSVFKNGTNRWMVKAEDFLGHQTSSIWQKIIFHITPATPDTLSPVMGFVTTNEIVTLSWNSVLAAGGSPIQNYQVEYSSDAGYAVSTKITVTGNSTNIGPLVDGVWYWKVREVDTLNTLGSNTISQSFVVDSIAPEALLMGPDTNSITYSAIINLDWSVSDSGTGVMSNWLMISTNNDTVADVTFAFAGTTGNYQYNDFKNGTNFWMVKARDYVGLETSTAWKKVVVDTNFQVTVNSLTASDKVHGPSAKLLNNVGDITFTASVSEITPITSMTLVYAFGKAPTVATNDGLIAVTKVGSLWMADLSQTYITGRTGALDLLLLINGRVVGSNPSVDPWIFELVGRVEQKDSKGVNILNNVTKRETASPVIFSYAMEEKSTVSIYIHDISGKKVRTIVSEERSEGYYVDFWDLKDDAGKDVAPGLYFALIKKGNSLVSKKVIVK